jgi:glycosyltransferase involved in cell wall biosynthesis
MKILMVLMNEFTHDLRVLKEGKSLIESGHDVNLIALKDDHTLAVEMTEGIHVFRIQVKSRSILPKNYIFWFIKYLEFVKKAIHKGKKLKPDIVHCHDLNTLIIGTILKKKLKIPLVYDSHELYLDRNFPKPVHVIWKTIERYGIRRADKVFVENPSRGLILEKRYGIHGTIPLRNCQQLKVYSRTDVLKRKLELGSKERIVLYQGIVTKARGMDTLLEMMNFLPDFVHLVILGDGAYFNVIKDYIDNKNLRRIHLLGQIPLHDLPSYTASADIGISLIQNINKNHYYALSNKIFEYMSAGLPVVFSDFPEMRRVITEEQVGLVVDETNPDKAAQAVMTILNNPDLYNRMSRNAIKAVQEKYNWDKEVQILKDYYDSLSK